MRTTLRFWRWRTNALKRRSDRVEAWAVLLSGLALVVGAPAAGVAAGLGAADSGPHVPPDWHRASAVLTRKAPAPAPPDESSRSDLVRATVQWRTADGSTHSGPAWVMPNTPAGTRTTVWLDGTGALQEDPVRAVHLRALAFGTAAAAGTAALAVGGYVLVHVRLRERRASALDREWTDVGPKWRPHRA